MWYGMISIFSIHNTILSLTSIVCGFTNVSSISMYIGEVSHLLGVYTCIQVQTTYMHTSRGIHSHSLKIYRKLFIRLFLVQILVLSSNTKKGEIERTFLNPLCFVC